MRLMRPLLLAVLCGYGCTSFRPVEPGAVPAVLAELRLGERISVRTADGWREALTVTALTDTELEAEGGGESVTIRRADVLGMKVARDAPGKTVGLAAGIAYGFMGFLVFFVGGELD